MEESDTVRGKECDESRFMTVTNSHTLRSVTQQQQIPNFSRIKSKNTYLHHYLAKLISNGDPTKLLIFLKNLSISIKCLMYVFYNIYVHIDIYIYNL